MYKRSYQSFLIKTPHFLFLVDNGKCQKGVEYKKDCNVCVCDPETGESDCTELKCPRSNVHSDIKFVQKV